MGHWASDATYGYMLALRQKAERTAFAISQARLDLGPVAVRSDQFAFALLVVTESALVFLFAGSCLAF